MKSPLANLNWSLLSMTFLWPLFKSAREKYESSYEAMKDGVKQLKKIDMDRYAKPIRKRSKAWTRIGSEFIDEARHALSQMTSNPSMRSGAGRRYCAINEW